MDGMLPNDVHVEFAKRVEEHLDRVDTRLKILEEEMKSYSQLALNIERLSLSTENLCDEMKEQSNRLKALEDQDGQKWRQTVTTVLTVVIGAVIGYIFSIVGVAA